MKERYAEGGREIEKGLNVGMNDREVDGERKVEIKES